MNNTKSSQVLKGVRKSWSVGSVEFNPNTLPLDLLNHHRQTPKLLSQSILEDPLFAHIKPLAKTLLEIPPGRAFLNCDYDVDGTTSASILKLVLESMGWTVEIFIPDRVIHEYGTNQDLITKAAHNGASLIICADCGSTDLPFLSYIAKEFDTEVMVIDHHRFLNGLCDGVHFFNPHQFPEINPTHYCTASICCLLAHAMASELSRVAALLPTIEILTGIAAIADVVSVCSPVNRNSILRVISPERHPLKDTLKALIKESQFTTSNIAFSVVPALNAAGRLSQASQLIQLFTGERAQQFQVLSKIKDLNTLRKQYQEQVVMEALKMVQPGEEILITASRSWNPGVVGPAAGQLCEKLGIPVVLGGYNELKKKFIFSGRSTESIDLYTELKRAGEGLPISRIGGHSVALGMTIEELHAREVVTALRKRFKTTNHHCTSTSSAFCKIPYDSLDLKWIEDFKKLEPFGVGFKAPLFVLDLPVAQPFSALGKTGTHLAYKGTTSSRNRVEILAFHAADIQLQLVNSKQLVVELGVGEYAGKSSVQAFVKDVII